MGRRTKGTLIPRKKKSTQPNDFSIEDAENFEPPQQSSTPAKTKTWNSNRILKDNNSLNISIIKNQNVTTNVDSKFDHTYKSILPVIEESYKYNRVPELFCSDPEEEIDDIEEEESIKSEKNLTVINDSDDKWTTLSDVSKDKSDTNVSDLLAEIDADIQVRFEKPPRRSYPGRKRNNKSLFEDEEEKEVEFKVATKNKKPKQKKKINPQEEAFIQSINEHFNDVETFSLIVE